MSFCWLGCTSIRPGRRSSARCACWRPRSSVLGSTAPQPNLREETLKEDFGSRVLVPIVGRAGRLARRVTPLDARERIEKKLMLAGSPAGWDAERVLAFKIIGAVAGFVLRCSSCS